MVSVRGKRLVRLAKKSFLFEALTVSDLQRGLEAQAFKICLLKFFCSADKFQKKDA